MTTANKPFLPSSQSAFDARYEAQKIAFAPVVFQCVHYAWHKGVLDTLGKAGERGLNIQELVATGQWSRYALQVSLESCLSAGVVYQEDTRFVLSKVGYCIIADKMTQVNFNFIKDVCYQGLDSLAESLDTQTPLGLKALGEWPTIYQGLSTLPEPAKTSWFEFDHYYSDNSFPEIMPDVFASNPRHVMDIGANTGKFASAALNFSETAELHLVDLPQQLQLANETLMTQGLQKRAHFHPVDMLNPSQSFPAGMDLIWMSQFLSCFSEEVITGILQRAVQALAPRGQVLIMDTFWDAQRFDIASFCLINTSPYFSTMASGNSKVYAVNDYIDIAQKVGLKLLAQKDQIGYCHSLLRFTKNE